MRISLSLLQQLLGQRLQAVFAGNSTAGAALWLEGKVDVLQLAGVEAGADEGSQLVGELALIGNGFENGAAALLEGFKLLPALFAGGDGYLVQVARSLFAVAADK